MNKPLSMLAVMMSLIAILLAAGGQTFRRVDAAGLALRMLMTGSGGPTVVFEEGSDSTLETWVRVQPEVSKFTSTISYDRAGNGLSEKGSVPREGRQIATELHAALVNARATPPYILVGHSLGGPDLRNFAGLYPGEVAGMVLVDPTQEELVEWAQARQPRPQQEIRPDDEGYCTAATLVQAHESRIPPGVPVVLISGMGPREIPGFLPPELKKAVRNDQEIIYPAKLKFYREWVEKIPGAKLIVTENSWRSIPIEEPELIVNAIRQAVAQAASRPVTATVP